MPLDGFLRCHHTYEPQPRTASTLHGDAGYRIRVKVLHVSRTMRTKGTRRMSTRSRGTRAQQPGLHTKKLCTATPHNRNNVTKIVLVQNKEKTPRSTDQQGLKEGTQCNGTKENKRSRIETRSEKQTSEVSGHRSRSFKNKNAREDTLPRLSLPSWCAVRGSTGQARAEERQQPMTRLLSLAFCLSGT